MGPQTDFSDDDELPVAVAIDSGELPARAEPDTTNTAAAPAQAPVPVTLITGYLGAGKTTLVRYILNERHGFRIAVILNEYGGETGLESAFVQNEQGDRANVPQWVELANGCLCCSVKAEFVQALEGLMQHAGKYDYVLVETTGLANPGPIMSELWTDEELEAAVVLDGVVAVVDGRNVGRQLAEARQGGAANEAQLQVALADVILLNKLDLLDQQQAAAVQQQLRAINSAATIIPTSHSRVDLGQLLNRGAYHLRLLEQGQQQPAGPAAAGAAPTQVPLQWLREVESAAAAAAGHHGSSSSSSSCTVTGCSNPAHCHDHSQHNSSDQASLALSGPPCQAHDAAVRTVSLRVSRPVQLEQFRAWIEGLVWDQPAAAAAAADSKAAAAAAGGAAPAVSESAAAAAAEVAPPGRPEVLRMKGLLHVAGSPQAHMFQAVYDLYDIVPGPGWQQLQQHTDAGSSTRLVVIGRYLDQQQLQRQLEQCCHFEA